MKTVIEQVDEFMEGLANGSILFFNAMSQQQQLDHTWVTSADTRSQKLADIHVQILNDKIPLYAVMNEDANKENLAFEMHYSIIMLRSFGIIMNNPNELKDLQFFKERCRKLEAEKETLEKHIVDLVGKIQDLRVGSGAIR